MTNGTVYGYGMDVALDDVGGGYSTIETHSLLKPNLVKIDQFYVKDCHNAPSKLQFLHKVIKKANLLGIEVFAEGIRRNKS